MTLAARLALRTFSEVNTPSSSWKLSLLEPSGLARTLGRETSPRFLGVAICPVDMLACVLSFNSIELGELSKIFIARVVRSVCVRPITLNQGRRL